MSWLKSMMEKEPPDPANPIGTVVIGNIEPDMHDACKRGSQKATEESRFQDY